MIALAPYYRLVRLQMGYYDVAVATFRKSGAQNLNLAISWANSTPPFFAGLRMAGAPKR
jgi:hypothetical protein